MKKVVIFLSGAALLAAAFFLLRSEYDELPNHSEIEGSVLQVDVEHAILPKSSPQLSRQLQSELNDSDEEAKWEYLCGRAEGSSTSYASQDEVDAESDRIRKEMNELSARLASSSDAEHLLAAGLIGSSAGSRNRFETLAAALDRDPDNSLILFDFVRACARGNNPDVCREQDVVGRAIAVDGGNGALWQQIVLLRLQGGDHSGALSAMRNAGTAPGFNYYFVENWLMFERGLAAAANQEYSERTFAANGLAVGVNGGYAETYRVCKEKIQHSAEWEAVCLRIGQRMEQESGNFLATSIGIDLQKRIFEAADKPAELGSAERRYQSHKAAIELGISSDIQTVMAMDERVMAEFVAEWAAHGELAATKYSRDEVERLKSDPDYNPCSREIP